MPQRVPHGVRVSRLVARLSSRGEGLCEARPNQRSQANSRSFDARYTEKCCPKNVRSENRCQEAIDG